MTPTRPGRLIETKCHHDIKVSFEFFPPKTEKMEEILWKSIHRLEPMEPQFVSVTYGAGGSTRERTHTTVTRLVKETALKPAAHLTCVAATKQEIDEVVRHYWQAGIRHIVALRGDPPDGLDSQYTPFPGGYENGADLVGGIKKIANFEISVAAYPETHPESPNWDVDIDMLEAKVDAGADRAITQFFFDNDHYFRYLERVRARSIKIPITPGIIPIYNFQNILRFADRCQTDVPPWLYERFEGLDGDTQTLNLMAAVVAAEQVMDLADRGVKEFHFYTLNRANLVYATCCLLGCKPQVLSDSKKQAQA